MARRARRRARTTITIDDVSLVQRMVLWSGQWDNHRKLFSCEEEAIAYWRAVGGVLVDEWQQAHGRDSFPPAVEKWGLP